MTEKRIQKLEAIGLEWRSFESEWLKKFEALKIYERQNGHTRVPMHHKELGLWVRTQRARYKAERLTDKRKDLLDEIDFQWIIGKNKYPKPTNIKKWNANFKLLQEYKKKHGNTKLPQKKSMISEEYTQLSQWANFQRQKKKKGTLEAERENLLNSIGFDWNS